VDANGECCFNVSETESFAAITPELIKECQSHLEEASIIVLDGNLSLDSMRCALDIASHADIPGEWNFLRLLSHLIESSLTNKNIPIYYKIRDFYYDFYKASFVTFVQYIIENYNSEI